ncbi:site-specific integrase [Paenibacillus melissococcoides]|uniref:Site-specific integrase n=1 Tax=Paenibacillus melissococcoides TaxID=2912268 RepID=A0ABN8U9E3_9BACL|nr:MULTISPECIES: tyrosine-type recombinase/integrase [Paenibacillus]MEB9892861.1 tyrosine-type recombinase/integrase [Bacillus cereus]CAH8247792.1 site-specific integrase [Paenibacillus melissococcoides]CAH8719529.1 site-specific integrase [Paenibacillus melissococcoides]CAH8720536.1 site-specific integrase [Paenibacillus melissococcoides]GIO81511.1 site-specific integrase [Paenibacillus dendritiformis]
MYCTQVATKKGKKWVCVTDGPADPLTGKRNQVSRRGTTKKEAMKRVEDAINKLSEHGLVHQTKEKITFEKLAKEWLNAYKVTGVKKSTVHLRSKQIKNLNKYLAKMTVSKITPKMYQNILNSLHTEESLAESTIEGIHVTASMIFEQAVIWGVITKSPTKSAKLPKKRVTVEELEKNTDPIAQKYLEKHELKEFLNIVSEHGLTNDKAALYILAFTGIRVGELCALKWDDVNFDQNEIKITKTIFNPNNNMKNYDILTPKTTTSVRRVSIDTILVDMLRNHKAQQTKMRALNKNDYHGNFVIANPNGYPYVIKKINVRVKRILKKTSITKKVTPHTLRHTHISMLAEAGVDLKTIMDRVGHKDMKTTMQIYTHVTEKMKKTADEKLKNYMEDIIR